MSYYHFGRQTAEARMEDDEVVRLEMEWTVKPQALDAREVIERHQKGARTLEEQAEKTTSIAGLAPGWTGFLYNMSHARVLVTLMFLAPDRRRLTSIRMHFKKNERELRTRVVQLLSDSFQVHDGARVPWVVYDMSVEVDPSFHLINTAFNAGRKMLVFQKRLTRLYIWQFSLADMLLRKQSLPEWAAGFLNGFKSIRAVQFVPQADGTISTVRKLRHLLGHYDEIGRGCFKYHVGFKSLETCNAILLWVYSFRSQRDLESLGELAPAA